MNSTRIIDTHQVDSLVAELRPLAETIEAGLKDGVAIYGAGFVGRWACKYLTSIGAKVISFLDRDPKKQGTLINGVPVIAPDDAAINAVSHIFIAARHAIKQVDEFLASHHNLNRISFDAYYVVKNYARFASIRDNYFEDPRSIETFNAILISMLTSSTACCYSVMEKNMYFAMIPPDLTGNEIFVDAGAFVGDTIERFIWENMGTFRHIYAFEPGRPQFQAMEKRMSRLAEEWAFDLKNVSLVRAGLSSAPGRMARTFADESLPRQGLEDLNAQTARAQDSIEVYSLDFYLNGNAVTFIKADVEGMEMELLRGAQDTIRRFKPKMALCAYHYPSDLYEIAEYIRSLVPEYKFSLRQHAPIHGDFVLYCYTKIP
jgi:FkbM family methyltransferase